MIPDQISFSDTAKYADAARSAMEGHGFVVHHSFFDINTLNNSTGAFLANFPLLPSWIMRLGFTTLGASDSTIVLLGLTFYLLLLVGVFYFAKKLFSFQAGVIAVLLLLSDPYFPFYSVNFTPEVLLSMWILLCAYTLTLKGAKKTLVLFPLVLSYFTKQQYSVIFLAVCITLYVDLTRKLDWEKKIKYAAALVGVLIFLIALGNLNVASNFSPIKAMYSANMLPNVIPGDYLRGEVTSEIGVRTFASKTFYNLYNFAKDPTRISSWIVLMGGILVVTIKKMKPGAYIVKIFACVLFFLMVLASSISLPNARYIHPVIPLIAVLVGGALWELSIRLNRGKLAMVALVGISLIPIFGSLTLDRRFQALHTNSSKPTSVRLISQTIDNYTNNGLVLTNLDAWGAWYNNLLTMWFPLSMTQIQGKEDKIDYIAISDYNSGDADFRLGDWEKVLSQDNFKSTPLADKYVIIYLGTIPASEVKENKDIRIVVLKRHDKQD